MLGIHRPAPGYLQSGPMLANLVGFAEDVDVVSESEDEEEFVRGGPFARRKAAGGKGKGGLR